MSGKGDRKATNKSSKGMEIHIARIYDETADHGRRILIDRLWPRGVSKERADLDDWVKEVAPSNELRRWFGHDPARWEEFAQRYRSELEAHPENWQPLLEQAQKGPLLLLYGAKDEERNQAVVLRDYLMEKAAEQRRS